MVDGGVTVGLAAESRHVVGDEDTAIVLGSGSLPVLGTPRLLAWLEAVCCDALVGILPAGSTSVGTRTRLEHLAASPVGATVTCRASVVQADGRLLHFHVVATRSDDSVLANGELVRVVVDEERFLSRLRSV